MQDRIPLYPGRVVLTPVSGQENTYDMTRADQPTQEGTPLNKASLLKDATAALYGLGSDAVPDDVLSKLSGAVIIDKKPLSEYSEGDIITLNEGGSDVELYVAKHDYESGLNGAGRTLLVRKSPYETRVWDSGDVNTYANSDIDAWLNGTYLNLFSQDMKSLVSTTKFQYTPGNGANTVGTLERSVFLLSATEFGLSEASTEMNVEGSPLPIASKLRIHNQWTRTPWLRGKSSAFRVWSMNASSAVTSFSLDVSPAFTLPSTFVPNIKTVDILGNPITIGPQIATGSYVGTGTYGSNNKNNVYVGFYPKLFIVYGTESTMDFWFFRCAAMSETDQSGMYGQVDADTGWGLDDEHARFVPDNGGGIRWWYDGTGGSATSYAAGQLNTSGKIYYYVAIG